MWRRVPVDPIVALGLLAFGLDEVWRGDLVAPGDRRASTAVIVLMTVPLAWRRREPLSSFALVMAGLGLKVATTGGDPPDSPFVDSLLSIYAVSVSTGRRTALACGGISLVLGTLYLGEILAGATFAVAWAAGWMVRSGRVQLRVAERERDQRARQAVVEERGRIARELHDVVSHAMSTIIVQAGAERLVLQESQRSTREVLAGIESTGRQAMAEMRRLLGVLRDGDVELALAPQPGLAQLDPLLEQVRSAGLPVDVLVEGTPIDLPAGVDVSAFRIVQEGLTNALRHAGAAHASVVVRYRPGEVEVEVCDDGRGGPAGEAGHGLIGMRERVALFGGELRAGPRPQGGFAVRARLPVEDGAG
jgi:signal transduction histidine kinase